MMQRDIERVFEVKNFWIDVLKIWNRFSDDKPVFELQVKEQLIWYNSNILKEGRPCIIQSWYEAGIKKIGDLVQENGQFYSVTQIENKYKLKTQFLDLLGLIQAIPLHWKNG